MIQVNILLNMFLNFISSEVILPTYFAIQGFERQARLTNLRLSLIFKITQSMFQLHN